MRWEQVNPDLWQRTDGLFVKFDKDSPYPATERRRSLMWTAWDLRGSVLSKTRKGSSFTWPRRFQSPIAAMKAVDQEWPL